MRTVILMAILMLTGFIDEPPALVSGSDVELMSDTIVRLSWNGNEDSDLDGYTVYYGRQSRNQPGGCPYEFSVTTDDTSILLLGLQPETLWHFAVTAKDFSGNESFFSPELSIYIQALSVSQKPLKPINLQLAGEASVIDTVVVTIGGTLTALWQQPELLGDGTTAIPVDSISWNIYFHDTISNELIKANDIALGLTSDFNVRLQANRTYAVLVSATAFGNESDLSEPVWCKVASADSNSEVEIEANMQILAPEG